jgi:peptidyl-prolyl cis-trans isomerase SurA
MVLAVGGVLAIAGPVMAANPFAPALTVNEGVVTHYEIDQRMLLLEALGASGNLRELAIEQLTEDRVKLQAAEAMEVELPEAAATAGLEEFATARGLAVEDVERVLEARGIDRQTMDDFVLAGLAWREVVAVRYRARATPSEADLDAALALAATTPREMLQLAEIALPFGERGEAETLELADRLYRELARGASFEAVAREYSRSATAERGGLLEPMPATQLPPAIRPQVLLLGPGQVTRPVPISGGVAILKLAAIRQEPPADVATDEAAREALRQRLFTERITSFGQGYLQELLSDALIIER